MVQMRYSRTNRQSRKICERSRFTNLPIYKQWRKDVLSRDGRTCQMPGCGSKRTLNAHHIHKWASSPLLRYTVDNGITLCRDCHKKVNTNEEYYAAMFGDIIRRKKQ